MHVLVSGSNGRIGKVLVKRLRADGHLVSEVDLTGDSPTDFSQVDPADFTGLDCVIHLAASTSNAFCEENTRAAITNNIVTTEVAIKIANNNNCPLLFTSSAAVYGTCTRTKGELETYPIEAKSLSFYGATKRISEQLISESSVKHCILRLFNVLSLDKEGPSLVPMTMRAIEDGKELVMNSDGSATRDFVSIETVVDAISMIVERRLFSNEIYNLGSGYAVSVKEVISSLCDKHKYDGKIRIALAVHPGVQHSLADISKLGKMLPDLKIAGFYEVVSELVVI